MTSANVRFRVPLALLATAVLVAGCGGGGGSDGKKGPPGVPGDPATTPTTLTKFDDAPGVKLAVTALSGGSGDSDHFMPGDTLSVDFTLAKNDDAAWGLAEMTSVRIMVSGPSFNYQRVIAEQSDVMATAVKIGDGAYRYTFATPIPATYLAPLNDTVSFGAEDGELQGESLMAGTYTVGLYGYWDYMVDGQSYRDAGNVEADFLLGSAVALEPREVVTLANCNQCHVDLQTHSGRRKDIRLCVLCHTSGAEDGNEAGVAGGTPGVTVDFRVLIHKLHNGKHLPSVNGVATNVDGSRNYAATPVSYEVADEVETTDFSEVAFPVWPNLTSNMPKDLGYSALTTAQKLQEDAIRGGVTACLKCHGDPDGSGPLPAPAQGDLHKAQPGKKACGSCHDDIDWASPYMANDDMMPAQDGSVACNICHAAEGTSLAVVDGHYHPLENPDVDPGVVVDVTNVSGGTGAGGKFQAGDKPSLTFTIENNDGDPVELTSMDAAVSLLVGPSNNQQVVMPYTGTNNLSYSPYDFAGRLQASSTTNKGTMSKVIPGGTTVAETLAVEFSSATAFSVTGTVSGDLGSSALPASPSTNPSGSSISALILTSAAVPQTITVAFSGAQAFTVTGSTSGLMGSGTLPSTVSGSNFFISDDGTVSFVVTVGTTAFASGNSIYLTVFKGAIANPVLFAIVAGRTSFSGTAPAPDRLYYEFVPPASSYTIALPMELVLEYLGDGSGSAGQTFTAGNLPAYFGRQVLSEVTAVASATTLAADVAPFARYVDVASTAGYTTASTTYVVLDSAAGVGTREYLQLGFVESATRMWFKSPVRYAHASGAAVAKPTLTFRQEGAANQYTLIDGTVTSVVAFGSGNGVVMTYRTDGRFGYNRHNGDTLQTSYQPPQNDSDTLGPEWGEWVGKNYADGTYTASLWLSRNLQVGLQGEVQTYRSTSVATDVDFLYGATASEVVPHEIISSSANCNACHNDVQFHGGGRRGFEACRLCHSVAGAEDKGQYDITTALPTTGVTIDYRTMLHKIHKGADLAYASTYAVIGNQASVNMYPEVEFPALPGRTKNCIKCHGTDSESWLAPADRDYPSGQTPTVREWRSVCNSCHDSDAATAHIDAQTAPSGVESCELCHAPGKEFSVEVMHKPR